MPRIRSLFALLIGLSISTAPAKAEDDHTELEQRIEALDALRFSPTTVLTINSSFVTGSNHFRGSAKTLIDASKRSFGATTFNYDVKLILDTSFTGRDLLHIRLRSGNFEKLNNSFAGAGPSTLSQLEVAFQEQSGPNRLAINRIYYQVPIGDFTFTLGGRVEQDNMLAITPSLYPAESILDLMSFAGAIGANNMTLGAGAGVWWQRQGLAISANYVAANGASNFASTSDSDAATTVQIGYQAPSWGIAAIYSHLENDRRAVPYGTTFTITSLSRSGSTDAFGISAYWQPTQRGWAPSISAGWGINQTTYSAKASNPALVSVSQSWSVGLQWDDAFLPGNILGMAVGEPTFATSLTSGAPPNDGNLIWEWWYRYQISDNVSITPGLFYLSRPLGADTPSGRSFAQLGGLVKTSFSF